MGSLNVKPVSLFAKCAINFFKFKLYRGTVPLTVENLNNSIW
jgi:hypothetical protein